MFSQGVYYKFGKNVFSIYLVKNLPLFILGTLSVAIPAIFFGNVAGKIYLYGTPILILLAGVRVFHSWYQYVSRQFMLDDFSLHIRSGIFNRKEIAIPYRQIQDVSLVESYVQRMFGVVELSVSTAAQENISPQFVKSSDAVFPLIDHAYAVELRQELLRRSNVQEIVNRTAVEGVSNTKLNK